MGEEGRKGELFGLVNMFTFQGEGGPGGLLVKEVVNKTNVAEGRMGVRVIGYDAEKGDGDDDADGILDLDIEDEVEDVLSQTAEGKPTKRKRRRLNTTGGGQSGTNPIQAILAAAGVHYTHENSEVIGSSAIEAQISKRAVAAATGAPSGDTSAFGGNQGDGAAEEGVTPVLGEGDTVELNGVTYTFHPPEDVRRRQFCEMSRVFGFGSAREFALVVEGWTPTQRRKALERFYRILWEEGLERLRKRKSDEIEGEPRREGEGEGEGDKGKSSSSERMRQELASPALAGDRNKLATELDGKERRNDTRTELQEHLEDDTMDQLQIDGSDDDDDEEL